MPSEPAVIVRLRGVAAGYGATTVLRAVDLEIRAGEFWFVLGPNGCGKTTLMRTLLGLLPPQAGEVWRSPEQAALERIGFIPQRCAINPALPTTVREFVSLGGIGTHRPRHERAADLGWALERSGLGGLEARDYWSLSGGQRQRALVARALVRRPSLLVFDEPTEGLDRPTEEAFLRTLEELRNLGGTTLLFVTHRLEMAERHATHIALVRDGGLVGGQRHDAVSVRAFAAMRGDRGDPGADPGDPS